MTNYLKKHPVSVGVVLLLALIVDLSTVVGLSLNAVAINALIAGSFSTFIVVQGVGLLLHFVYVWGGYTYEVKRERLCQLIGMEIRSDIASRIGRARFEEVMKRDLATYISWETQDIDQLLDNGVTKWFSLVDGIFLFVFAMVSLWLFHWVLGVVTLLSGLILVFLPRVFLSYTNRQTEQLSRGNEAFITQAQNLMAGFDIFYSFNAVGQLYHRIKQASEELSAIKVQYQKGFSRVTLVTGVVNFACKMSIDALTMVLVLLNQVSIGTISAAGSLMYNCFAALESMVQKVTQIQTMGVYFKKFQTIEVQESQAVEPFTQTVSLQDVSIYAADQAIVSHLSMTIEKGKKYAIVGDSGSGKSTLLRFLAGRNSHFTGEVTVDGQSLSPDDIWSLRDRTIYVDQKNHIFNASVSDNVTLWGNPEDVHLLPSLQIESFSHLDEEIGQFGRDLSGGQRQRIALQRALMDEDKILLLDESFANLDAASVASIESEMMTNPALTILLVTHHLREAEERLFDEIIPIGREVVV